MWLAFATGKTHTLNGISGSFNGTEYVYQPSHNPDESKGIALLLHGCSRSSHNFWTKSEYCVDCIGASVQEKITEVVVSMNFFSIAVSSVDRVTGCWSPQDFSPMDKIIPYIYNSLLPHQKDRRLPLYLICSSSGAKFASAYIPTAQKAGIKIDGLVLMNVPVYGIRGKVPNDFPLVAHINMANSPNAPQHIPGLYKNAREWEGFKICNETTYHHKEYIPGPKKVTLALMSQFVTEIPNTVPDHQKFIDYMISAKFMSKDGYLYKDPRKSNGWRKLTLTRFPQLRKQDVGGNSRIGDLLDLAFAGHMHTHEYVDDALAWMLKLQSMTSPQSPNVREIAKNEISRNILRDRKIFKNINSNGEAHVRKKPFLCVTFVRAFDSVDYSIALNNSKHVPCDWAFVIYSDDVPYGAERIAPICSMDTPKGDGSGDSLGRVVYCKRSVYSVSDITYIKNATRKTIRTADVIPTIVKPVMYIQLASIIQKYERIIIADSDISFINFDFSVAARVWSQAYTQPPMIVHPLLSTGSWGGNLKSLWVKEDIDAIMAACLSQQVAFFDSSFLHWYITRVMTHTTVYHLVHSSACGLDNGWCAAAKWYGEAVAGYSNFEVPCAILTNSSNVVHHLNTKSLGFHKSRDDSKKSAQRSCNSVKSAFEKTFPEFKSIHPDAKCASVKYLKASGTAVTLSKISTSKVQTN